MKFLQLKTLWKTGKNYFGDLDWDRRCFHRRCFCIALYITMWMRLYWDSKANPESQWFKTTKVYILAIEQSLGVLHVPRRREWDNEKPIGYHIILCTCNPLQSIVFKGFIHLCTSWEYVITSSEGFGTHGEHILFLLTSGKESWLVIN